MAADGRTTVPWSLGSVDRLEPLPNGDLIATGLFTQIGGVACSLIARWDGTTWHPLGAGSTTLVYSFAVTTSGDVVAAGTFATATGPASIARWNGSVWTDVGAGVPMTTGVLEPLPNDEVLLIGAGGSWASTGGSWQPFAPWPTNPPPVNVALALPGGELLAGGDLPATPAVPAHRFARWNGTAWQAANPGSNGVIGAVAVLPAGGFFAGGSFSSIGGIAANRLAWFDGAGWHPIASSAVGTVKYAIARPNGEVVVGGEFPNVLTGGMDFVARWNGGAVTPIYAGLWGARVVRALALAGNGDALLAYLDFSVLESGVARTGRRSRSRRCPARSRSTRWSSRRTARCCWPARSSSVAATSTSCAGTRAARPARGADAAAAEVQHESRARRLQPREVRVRRAARVPELAEQRDRARGRPHGARLAERVRAQRPRAAVPLPHAARPLRRRVADRAPFARDHVAVGQRRDRRHAVVERAWIGGSLRTAASGLPASAASIGVFGFAPVLQPLAQLHPLGAPGCYLLTTDDILLQFTVTGGAALPDLPVPNTPALVGGQFLHQVLGVELDAAGHPAAITSSNALLLTVGAL